jgi:hypothetical protein
LFSAHLLNFIYPFTSPITSRLRMAETSIEWTDATWNPVAGCTIVSAGCTNCYAMRMAARLQSMGMQKYQGLTRRSGGRHIWTGKVHCDLDVFAPGWRQAVDLNQSQNAIRASLLEYWLGKIRKLGVSPAQGIALVSGERNQRLYWLVFVSRSDFATNLWEDIREPSQRPSFIGRARGPDSPPTMAQAMLLKSAPFTEPNSGSNDTKRVAAGSERS